MSEMPLLLYCNFIIIFFFNTLAFVFVSVSKGNGDDTIITTMIISAHNSIT